ncbi:MAG: hypothetical protein Q8O30_04865 [Candidatus Omnitrophota bacterium]|nr:hypothetical protein [Candidatus Omnitrophota bacterium]
MLDSIQEQIKNKVEEIIKEFDIELVEFKLCAYNTKYNVRCLIDYPAGGITVDDCAKVNEKIFAYLEESKILGEDYTIEVNSPGLDRPLKTYKDFLRVQSRKLCLWLSTPLEGKDYLEGELIDLASDFLFLKCKDKIYKIEFNKVGTGKERVEI